MFPAWLAMRWKLVAHIDSLSVVCCDQVKLLECVMRLILSTVFLIIISGNALSQQAYQCTEIQRCENSYGGSKCTTQIYSEPVKLVYFSEEEVWFKNIKFTISKDGINTYNWFKAQAAPWIRPGGDQQWIYDRKLYFERNQLFYSLASHQHVTTIRYECTE